MTDRRRPSKRVYDTGVAHPAVFSDSILPVLASLLEPSHMLILDPFAGVGRVHEQRDILPFNVTTVGVELEKEWADLHPETQQGNALALDFVDGTFDAIVTSPTYGNRLADNHNAKDGSVRRSYTHDLGRQLTEDNSGGMQWGPAYRDFHRAAWLEVKRVLKPNGRLVLNISDHIRQKKRQYVSSWHAETLIGMGFALADSSRVVTPRLRSGAHSTSRVSSELVLALDRVD